MPPKKVPNNVAYAWRIQGSDSHLVYPNPGVIYDNAIPFRPCMGVHSTGTKCTHTELTTKTLSGREWNSDKLDLELQCLKLDALRADAKLDEARLQQSSGWTAAVGIMPTNSYTLYWPINSHFHWCRFRLTADASPALRALEDFTFEARIFSVRDPWKIPPIHLPPWAAHISLIRDQGAEIPLSLDRYTFPLDELFRLVAGQEMEPPKEEMKEMTDKAMKAIETRCVNMPPSSWIV